MKCREHDIIATCRCIPNQEDCDNFERHPFENRCTWLFEEMEWCSRLEQALVEPDFKWPTKKPF